MFVETQWLPLILGVIGEHAGQKVGVVVLVAVSLAHRPRMVLNDFLIFVLKELGPTTHNEAYSTT